MSVYSKFLISGGALVAAGGTGGGIYYVVSRENEDKVKENQKEIFSGYLIFEEKSKEDDANKKFYEVRLDENSEVNVEADKKCKFENNTLTCKVSEIKKKEADDYIKELKSELENLTVDTSEKLKDKLKEELEKRKSDINKKFGELIHSDIEKELTTTS